MDMVNKYGADAVRLYLVSSNISKAETLKFKEKGVLELVKTVFLPWHNSLRFLNLNWMRYNKS